MVEAYRHQFKVALSFFNYVSKQLYCNIGIQWGIVLIICSFIIWMLSELLRRRKVKEKILTIESGENMEETISLGGII